MDLPVYLCTRRQTTAISTVIKAPGTKIRTGTITITIGATGLHTNTAARSSISGSAYLHYTEAVTLTSKKGLPARARSCGFLRPLCLKDINTAQQRFGAEQRLLASV